jgi:glycosyltransferase involved in cell wall biosynthesis
MTLPPIICFSHLRWGFVYQRPNHLMARFAREREVYFVEEYVADASVQWMEIRRVNRSLSIVTPHIVPPSSPEAAVRSQRDLVDELMATTRTDDFVAWYYTPMALPFTRHLNPVATIYDCMDELTGFLGCPPELAKLEAELFQRADVVFTGGQSLYEAKRKRHPSVHAFPSSVDRDHFARARGAITEPMDQRDVRRPRIGFFGVIDERMDTALVDGVAQARPDWQIVMVGPVVKIDPAILPRRSNVHFLGSKSYEELPSYLAGWDVALIPFALNDATRFVSPTKTLEYLAAGKPVVSTSIRDVVRPYGEKGLVRVADSIDATIMEIQGALSEPLTDWLNRVDDFLAGTSWDRMWTAMNSLVKAAERKGQHRTSTAANAPASRARARQADADEISVEVPA